MEEKEKIVTRTKGNVIVEDIKVGDLHYEYDMGVGIKSRVLTLPKKDNDGNWVWLSQHLNSDKAIEYVVNPKYPHYSANLYDYEAYKVNFYI